MANVWYSHFKQLLGTGKTLDLVTDTIKVALVDTSVYTQSDTHQFFSSITGVEGTPQALSGKTLVAGLFKANAPTFTAVAAGNPIHALVLYKDTGVAGTSPLICYIDTATGGAQISVTPNGTDIIIGWNTTGIFQL